MIKDGIIATEKNFLPFTYGMKESVYGTIVGVKDTFVYMTIDTSHMSVLSILEAEEELINKAVPKSVRTVIKEEREEFISAGKAMLELVKDLGFQTDRERIDYIMSLFPEMKTWETFLEQLETDQ
ncbi:MAG: hypothetical protein J5769_03945 [Bacteroidales bacterium]|nr:hypothetical protein [Bacteroidales bacterium]